MKVKTFILTFLMMSCPFLFGQQHFNPDVPTGYETEKTITAKIVLDGETLTDASYEIATYVGDKCEGVSTIDAETDLPNGMADVYYTSIVVHGDNNTGNIHFRLWNGTNEYVSLNKIPFNGSEWTADEELGSLADLYVINFKSVAQIEGTEFDVVYPSLQEAIDAAANGDEVTLLKDNEENVTVVQAPNVAFTIDGAEKTMRGTITVNGKSAAYATAGLTIKNVNFDATNISKDASINLGGNNNTRYTNGVTVENCDFEGNGQTKAAIKNYTGGCKNLTVIGGTFTGLHSLMQVKGVENLAVSGVEVFGCKNGVSVGTSTNVAISSSDITATGYGVRADGSGAYEMTLTDNTISAELPVVVRKATGDYKLEVNGGSYTASNTEGYDVVFTNGDDGTYEAPTGVFQLTIVEGTELNVFPVYVAKIGTKGYQSLAEAIAAVGDGDVVIELLADVTFDYNARDAYGTTGTTSLTINGSGKTLTLNQKNSDWASFGLANADAKVVFNNMTIEKTGYGDTGGAWNTHAIIFSSNVEMTNVTVNNSMAVQDGATLNNVTINEANGYYGLWINGNGQSVTMNGGSITATNGGRGIKIADEYVGAPALVTLNVTGTKFNTAKKAAVLVSSTAGADITASNVDITNVAADNANFAWVDEDWAAHYGKVTVEGGALGQENLPSFAAALKNGDKVEGYYETLPEAVAAAQDGNTITMLQDDNVTETVKVNNNITIDLNGKTVTANCKKAFEVYANATIKNGTINSQSRCVDTRTNVELTLTSVNLNATEYIVENQQPLTIGGSADGTIVNMTNVNIDAGTQGYAIISFVQTNLTATNSNFSGYSALYVQPSSEGSNFSFVNSTLKSDIRTNDVEGNSFATIATDADDVTVTLDANSKLEAVGDNQFAMVLRAGNNNITVAGDITATNFLSGNVNNNTIKVKAGYSEDLLAEGYATTEADANGLVKVSGLAVAKIGETYYATLDEAFAAAQNGNEVKILVAGTYALSTSGKNIAITGAVDGVVFDNIGAKNMGGANVTFNNVTFDYYPNVNYTGLQHSGNLVYNDCTFEGQPFLYGTSETFNNCIFNQNSADAYNVWTYGAKEVAFNECTFNSVGKSVLIYTESATTYNEVAVTKCTFNASSPVDGKAAIEMDSSLSAGINLTIDGATTATGFGSGNVSGNSLWNNKKGNNDMANNDITVVVNDVTVLKPWAPVAKIGETPYETLAKAISAATAGETITICSDVNENVTVNKNLTIDGANDEAVGGKFNYTGTMTANAGLTVTVQNIDFVGGGFDKSSKSTTGNYTIKNCTFEDDGDYAYAFRFKGANSVTIEDCTVKNYLYSFLYITSGTNKVSVKNVTVEDCPSYAVYFASGVNTATIENLTVKNSNNGFVINNTANRTLNLKDCTFENVTTAINHSNGTNTVKCNLSGENDFGTSALSEYAKFVLTAADATLISPENLTVNVTTDLDNQGYVVEYNEGVYSVVAGNILNQTTGKKYAKLQAAIDEASEDDVIVLLKDITEDVTITKHLTIDGKAADATANSKYTGTMTVNAKLNVTVQDIDFDKGCINDPGDAHGYLTIKNCNFDGEDNSIAYAVTVRGGDKLTIENSTAKNYSTGMLYIPSAVANIAIKDVEVSNVAAAFNITYSGDGTFENVKVDNVTYGIHFQIHANGSRTYTVKNCDLKGATNPFWFWDKSNNTAKVTVVFEGDNDLGTKGITVNAGELQLATDATLTAAEGLTISATEEGYVVEYNEGVYSVVAGNILNQTTGKKYATIQDAINAAENGDKIVVLEDVDLSTNQFVTLDNSYNTYFKVEGKAVTIDLNGKTISGEYAITSPWLVGVFSTENNGHLTLEDNVGTAKVEITGENGEVYALIVNYESGCSITINGGTYKLDKAKDSHMYTGCNEGIIVNGGTFQLGNSGTGSNGQPWMFNAKGQNDAHVIVNGGTFNTDILHQYYAFEVSSARENALVYNESEKTWTVVKDGAVAYVEERYTTFSSSYSNEVGYATLADAVAAANKYDKNGGWLPTITLLKDVTLDAYVTISESVNLNLDQFNITRVDGTALYVNGEGIEVTINGEGIVSGTQAVYVDNGTVTINGGNYVGGYEAVYVINNGHAVINGGTFGAENDEDDTDFVLNEYDATRDVTTIAVYGGTFHGFNPENNAAEGTGTDFCAEGYGAVETAAGSNVWEVMPVQEQSLVKGWNWYSTYLDIETADLTSAMGSNGDEIKDQDGGRKYYVIPRNEWRGTLDIIDLSKMYMINVLEACSLKVAADVVDATSYVINLRKGWSWIGYPSNQEIDINTALANFTEPNEGDRIKSQYNGYAEYRWGEWRGSLKTLVPGIGYMYNNKTETVKSFRYNVTPVTTSRGTVEANVTAENNYWTPNATKYPFNMTMTAVVDGLTDANYEVAAFVNGEVRGSARPIYVEPMDAYVLFLTIHGEDVEEMSFRLYDIDNDTEYDLSDRINYSNNAEVGSLDNPYTFSRGTTGIGEASMSEVNIYPNPTTTGTEINLEATCDKVEVFNALGVKVVEYHNVDTIDALETAGIYVIRITNNGNVQNCRLVVK